MTGTTFTLSMSTKPPGAAGGAGGGGRGRGGPGRGKKQDKEKKPPTIRKSCDFCNGRKKKCDGDGVNKCSYCIAKNNPDCIYSPRRPQRPRVRKQAPPAPSSPAEPPPPPPTDRVTSAPSAQQQQQQQQQSAPIQSDAIIRPSLKRVRLGASLATGLVGTKENMFLADFFGCMGFLPLTCQSTVRDAMVKLLFAGASSSTPRVPYPHSNSISSSSNTRGVGGWNLGEETGSVVKLEGNFFDDRSGSIVAAAGTGTGCAASPMLVSASSLQLQQRPTQQVKKSNPSTCMFWCAVALGGLTQGQPIENMRPYIQLAEISLAGDVDVAMMPNVARAWTLMAYLYGFCGNSERFRECRRRAERYFLLSDEEDSADRSEFEVLIRHADGLDLFYGEGCMTASHLRSYIQDTGDHPQVSDAATSHDICHFVMESYRRFGQAFFTDVLGNVLGSNAGSGDGGGDDDGLKIEPDYMETDEVEAAAAAAEVAGADKSLSALLCGDDDDEYGNDGWSLAPAQLEEQAQDQMQERGEVFFVSGERALTPPDHGSTNMRMAMEDAMPEYERLQRAVDGPGVRGGIGGLMINCTSVVLKAAQGDIAGSVERNSRCVESLERYPGLIRFPMGLHIAHLLIVFLANFEERHLYTRMMYVYNPVRPSGSPPIPPLEEWEGISGICSHIYCRAIENRFRKQQQQQEAEEEQQQRQAAAVNLAGCGEGSAVSGGVSMPSTRQATATATSAATRAPGTADCYGGSCQQEPGSYTKGCRDAAGGVLSEGGSDSSSVGVGRSRSINTGAGRYGNQNLTVSYWSHPIQAPPAPHAGDDASSDDHDGATLSKDVDLDPMVTLSDLGFCHSQEMTTAAAIAAATGPIGGRPSTAGGSIMTERPRQGPVTSRQGSVTSFGQHHRVAAGGPASGAFGSNSNSSNQAASSQGGAAAAVDTGEGEKCASFAALEAAILHDDDDDTDDGKCREDKGQGEDQDGCGGNDGGDLEGRNSADLPEVASLETYSQLAETEEALAAGNFLEATFDMMERRRVAGGVNEARAANRGDR